MKRRRYRKNKNQIISAVQLDLETDGFTYIKWGGKQRCRAGDWLVNNNGNCYTINEQSFRQSYREIVPGQFVKTTPVWAYQAETAGSVVTKEGSTAYKAGDYVVSNNKDGTDIYAISCRKFESMYKLDEPA